MKKAVITLLLVLCIASSLASQTSTGRAGSGPLDLIVLLDTSVSMSDSYQETISYLSGPFLREFMRTGDTFHLISFSRESRLEIVRRVEGVGDVETIIGRLFLLYPLAREADPVAALDYAENYAASLPAARGRKIILISGSGDPEIQNAVNSLSARLSGGRTDIHYIKAPLAGTLPVSGRGTAQASASQAPPALPPPVETVEVRPVAPEETPSPVQSSVPVQPESAAPVTAESSAAATEPVVPEATPQETLPSTTALLPEVPLEEEPAPKVIEEFPESTTAAVPPSVSVSRSSGGSTTESSLSLPIIILIVLGLLVVGLVLFLVSLWLRSSPNRAMAEAAAPKNKTDDPGSGGDAKKPAAAPARPQSKSRRTPKEKPVDQNLGFENGAPLLSLFVEDQNTAIGRRNVHATKKGYAFTIGGGSSDFLIFLVPLPPHIAELVFDGEQCTLIPRRPEYFPDIGSQQIPACIGKSIRLVTEKNHELFMRIDRYEDPLLALNKLLHSIRVPGLL